MAYRRVLLPLLLILGCGDDPAVPDAFIPADAFVDPADAPLPPDAPPAADAAPATDSYRGDGAKLVCGSKALYEECEDGSECDSCLCFTLNMRSYCSQSCAGDGDCPSPSTGCQDIYDVCEPPPL